MSTPNSVAPQDGSGAGQGAVATSLASSDVAVLQGTVLALAESVKEMQVYFRTFTNFFCGGQHTKPAKHRRHWRDGHTHTHAHRGGHLHTHRRRGDGRAGRHAARLPGQGGHGGLATIIPAAAHHHHTGKHAARHPG